MVPPDFDPGLGAEFALNSDIRQRREQDGRATELLHRLDACLSNPWPEKDRDRLFWRIGQVGVASAAPALLRMTERLGVANAGYSLVWALARCAGGEAADVLRRIATSSANPTVRGLAGIASVSALMGEARFDAAPSEPLLKGIARAVESADPDTITGTLAEVAARLPTRVGPILVDLYHLAQQNPALHRALVATVPRLPARPPYLYGLRKLFKYAELLDDAPMFGAVAHRFETAQPMYQNKPNRKGFVFAGELGQRWVKADHLAATADGKPADVKTGLSQATLFYMKRRVWRTLRKRGELGQRSFVEMATEYLLAFADTDMVEEHRRFVWKRDENRGRFKRHTLVYGPFSYAWAMGHLLYRHSSSVQMVPSALTMVEAAFVDHKQRSEAFPQLWDEHPEFALRLAAETCCQNIANFGVRVLRANPKYLRGLAVSALETLLASHHAVVAQLAFEEARNRLARGKSDSDLLAALIELGAAGSPETGRRTDRLRSGASVEFGAPRPVGHRQPL